MSDQDRALVVGISAYPGLSDLKGPENDAKDFYSWLIDPQGGAVPAAQVKTIWTSAYMPPPFTSVTHAQPIAQEIERFFDDLTQEITDNGSIGRRLYVYLSGHGFQPFRNEAALLGANTMAQRLTPSSLFLGAAALDLICQTDGFSEVLLFMDCCRESATTAAPLLIPPPSGMLGATRPRQMYAFAARPGLLAREHPQRQSNGTPLTDAAGDPIVRGVFTTTLMEGLRGGASGADGIVTAGSLADFLANNLRAQLTDAELTDPTIAQDPSIWLEPTDRNWVLTTVPAKTYGVQVTFPSSAIGKTVKVRSGVKFAVVKTETLTQATWSTDLTPGFYLLQVSGADTDTTIEVLARPEGNTINV